ncbi:MAG TPA: MFS transporter [Anaerolineales bacterium]|nr:MFS transporter [Anaerolineales bacterium]
MEPQPRQHLAGIFSRLKGTRTALVLIFCIMLMDVVGISILYPVSAYIVRRYSSQALMVTLLSVVYSAAQFLAAPVLGKLSDRLGRRPVLLVSLFGSALGYLVFGIGGALWILFLSRLIDGITGGNMSTASAYIADISEPASLAKNLALIGMAWGIGLIIGPALGGILGQFDLRAPAFFAAGLSLLNMVLGYFFLPESLPKERRTTGRMHAKDFNALASIREMGRLPGLAGLLVVLSLYNFGFSGMNSTENIFLIRRFTAQPWQLGLLTMLVGVTVALVQFGLVQRLVSRFGEKALAVACLALQALGALATCLNPVYLLVYPIVILRSAVGVFVFPTLGALTTRRVSAGELGVLMGVTTAIGSLMSIFSPILAGTLYDAWAPAAPYWLTALLFLSAAFLLKLQSSPEIAPAN